LEVAAIRFTQADFAGAEKALQEALALSRRAEPAAQEEFWLALFDLYRATGQAERFDALAITSRPASGALRRCGFPCLSSWASPASRVPPMASVRPRVAAVAGAPRPHSRRRRWWRCVRRSSARHHPGR
jgi:hypothetical protein